MRVYIYIYMSVCVCLCACVLQESNVIYQFKCTLGDCISENINIYVGLTSTATHYASLWYQFNSTTSKKDSGIKIEFPKILTKKTKITERQSNKQKLQILEEILIRKKPPNLNRINFEFSTYVLKCLIYTYRTRLKTNTTTHQYKY